MIFDSRCSILGARFSMLDTRCSMLDTRQLKGRPHFDKIWSALFIGYRFEIMLMKKLRPTLGLKLYK